MDWNRESGTIIKLDESIRDQSEIVAQQRESSNARKESGDGPGQTKEEKPLSENDVEKEANVEKADTIITVITEENRFDTPVVKASPG